MIAKILIDNNTKNELKPEWGLSVWIEHKGHTILLDTGASGIFAENAESLGLDLSRVEYGVLSHAHFDHSDGLDVFFGKNKTAPFYLRKGSSENCYSSRKYYLKYIGIKKGLLDKYKDRIRYAEGDTELYPGAVLMPHKTPGLKMIGKKAGMYVRRGIFWRPDDFSHEQSLVLETEKGLVVFNSCSHGGADNIIHETEKTWPGKKIYALVGGLHLFRSSDEDVKSVAERVKKLGIEKIYTGHCTGGHQMEILKAELGDVVEQIYTGMEIRVDEQ